MKVQTVLLHSPHVPKVCQPNCTGPGPCYIVEIGPNHTFPKWEIIQLYKLLAATECNVLTEGTNMITKSIHHVGLHACNHHLMLHIQRTSLFTFNPMKHKVLNI